MTEATFNANNYIAFCSILSKFRMWMYDRMKNIYAQNQLSIYIVLANGKPFITEFLKNPRILT